LPLGPPLSPWLEGGVPLWPWELDAVVLLVPDGGVAAPGVDGELLDD
jgi:hypothetical protein